MELRYSPNQPRVPAGSREGGRWANGGGGGGAGLTWSVGFLDDAAGLADSAGADAADSIGADLADQTAFNIDPNVASDAESLFEPAQATGLIDLQDEEGHAWKGHAIKEHVGKDYAYLERRIRESIRGNWFAGAGYSRAGSFPSIVAANKLINSVLAENRSLIEEVVKGPLRKRARLNKWFTSPTGFEAFTKRPWDLNAPIGLRDTFGAAVIIERNPEAPKGFSIITAFPFSAIEE